MAGMTNAERRRAEISDAVADEGFVRIDALAERFRVTPMTIHRDLDALEDLGVVSKVRAGARAVPIEARERNVHMRQHHLLTEKRAIALAAHAWLAEQKDVQVVALDDSTTALAMVDGLIERHDLTVVTNFLPAIQRLSGADSTSVFALGGTLSHEFQSFLGSSTHEAIASIQIDVLCMSATSVGATALYHPSEGPLLVKRALIDHAQKSVLLVDHSKFTRRALHRQAAIHEFDLVVVDERIATDDLERLVDVAQRVIVAPIDGDDR